MPLYDHLCAAGHRFDRFVKLDRLGDQQRCECGQVAQRCLSAPRVVSDVIRPIRGMDGRMTDSLSTFRATLDPGGNPQGERYHEVGNETVTRPRLTFDKHAQMDAIRAGIEDVKNGRVPPVAMIED
jgi:hypothetical protein